MPIASGSLCSSNWVNNAGALNCFIQGEDESHAGVTHPHYVACSAAGDIFCCVDDDKGNQNCQAVSAIKRLPPIQSIESLQLKALLEAQQSHIATLHGIPNKVGGMENSVGAQTPKTSP